MMPVEHLAPKVTIVPPMQSAEELAAALVVSLLPTHDH